MSDNLITSKIELLEEQIVNIERSGFFTEAEIDRASKSLRAELERLTTETIRFSTSVQDCYNNVAIFTTALNNSSLQKYGMSDEEYEAAKIKQNAFLKQQA